MTHAPKRSSSRSADRWENEGGPSRPLPSPSKDAQASELETLGIASVQLTVFDWNGYRYSHVRDAIAAAKRGRRAALNAAASTNV